MHKKVIDMLDERGFKPLSVLKDDPGFLRAPATTDEFCYFTN